MEDFTQLVQLVSQPQNMNIGKNVILTYYRKICKAGPGIAMVEAGDKCEGKHQIFKSLMQAFLDW